MSGADIISALQGFTGRGAGTDAERRAARWLAQQAGCHARTRTPQAKVEPFWCRPNWALAQAWHTALALAGSLVAVASPRAGGAMLLAALVFVIADAVTGISPGRRLTREHASQNVVGPAPSNGEPDGHSADHGGNARLHLLVTTNYDAGRTAFVYRDNVRRLAARARRLTGALTPGWAGWLGLVILGLLVIAILRAEGHQSSAIGALQLVPTIGLLLALAALLEMGLSAWSPGAGDNGSGVAAAIAVGKALGVSPPRHLDVEVVLTGSGDRDGIGLHDYLRSRRATHRRTNTVVIGIGPCAAGTVRWWLSDGALVPLRYGGRVRAMAGQVALDQPHLNARPYSGRGSTPAFPARRAGIPAITVGCLDEHDLVPRSHRPTDVAERLDPHARDQAVQFILMLVDAIDSAVEKSAHPPTREEPAVAGPGEPSLAHADQRAGEH
jgi:hypothetical protein